MGNNAHPVNSIDFLNELPAFYAKGPEGAGSLLRDFLMQFEEMFGELQAAVVGDTLTLTYKGPGPRAHEDDPELGGHPLMVELFDAGRLGYPKNSLVFIPGNPTATFLAEPIEADGEDIDIIRVTDRRFLKNLEPGSKFSVRTSSGLTGLTSIREMPPPAFRNRGEKDKLVYLQYLASWVGLPVRSDKPVNWNRRFLREAMALDNNPSTLRSTLPGITALLNAWHKEEIVAGETIVTDLISQENGVDTIFCIGENRIGIDTLLGEEQSGRFHVYLTADPNDVYMRNPKKLDAMTAAAKLILDMEKPVHTEYTLHIRASTMQIAPDAAIASYKSTKSRDDFIIDAEEDELPVKDTNIFARIGVTTLIWD